MDFPSRLRQVRLERKLTQEQLGRCVDVTKVSISCYENGSRTPDLETLQKIADALGVSVDYLLARSDEPGRTTGELEQMFERAEQEDSKICKWFDEVLRAPKECRDELHKIWEIIKRRDK